MLSSLVDFPDTTDPGKLSGAAKILLLALEPDSRASLDQMAKHAWLNGGLDTVELQSSFLGLQQKQESMQTQLARIEAEIKDVFKHKEEEAERSKRLEEQHRRKRDAEANKKRWALAGAR